MLLDLQVIQPKKAPPPPPPRALIFSCAGKKVPRKRKKCAGVDTA